MGGAVIPVQGRFMFHEEISSLAIDLTIFKMAFDAIGNGQLEPVFASIGMILTDNEVFASSPEPSCANSREDAHVIFRPSMPPMAVLLIELIISRPHEEDICSRVEQSLQAVVLLQQILGSLCLSLRGQDAQLAHYHPTHWTSVAVDRCAVHGADNTGSMEDMSTSRERKNVDLVSVLISREQVVLADAADVVSFVGEESGVQSVLNEVLGEVRGV
jgi:hypothetical protein